MSGLARIFDAGELVMEHRAPAAFVIGLVILVALVGAISCWRYIARRGLAAGLFLLRLLFLLILAWCLFLPVQKKTMNTALKPRFVVLLDTSGSMSLSPGATVPTRMEVARKAMDAPWVKEVIKDCEIDYYTFATDLAGRMDRGAALEAAPTGASSHLRENLNRVFARYPGQRPAGMLLLTDALDTREGDDSWADGPWPCPVYTVPLETEGVWKAAADVRVESVVVPRRLMVGWNAELKVMITGEGTDGQSIQVRLRQNDQLIQESSTRLPEDGAMREVTFAIAPDRTGPYSYQVEVATLDGEINTNDNRYAVSVLVTDTRNRLLYLEDVPRWESKYLNRALEKVPGMASLSFVRGPGGRYITYGTRGAMTPDLTADQLAAFRVVVIGDFNASELTEARASELVKFVDSGGGLVLLGGPKSWGSAGFRETPLKQLLPVQGGGGGPPEEGKFPVNLTDDGRTHPAFQWAKSGKESIPPVLSVFAGGSLSPAAVALATADVRGQAVPLIAVMRYGQGKVASLQTDSLWRWSLDPLGGSAYAQFWTHLLQWMLPEQQDLDAWQLDLAADTSQTVPGEKITFDARLGGRSAAAGPPPVVTCEITLPDGRTIPYPMGAGVPGGKDFTYQTSFTPEIPGACVARATAVIGDNKAESPPFPFVVRAETAEMNPKPSRLDILQRIAVGSGGAYAQPDLLERIMGEHTAESRNEERVEYTTLWNTPWVFGMLAALLSLEWILRRTRNLA